MKYSEGPVLDTGASLRHAATVGRRAANDPKAAPSEPAQFDNAAAPADEGVLITMGLNMISRLRWWLRHGRPANEQPVDDNEAWATLAATDPTFAERYAEDQRRLAAEHDALAPVVADLAASGVEVESVRDLQRPGAPVAAATPLLIRWLPTVDQPDAKRRLIQVLGDPNAGEDSARALVAEFLRIAPSDDGDPISSVRANIGSALSVHDCDPIADELLAIAADRSHGKHRGMVVNDLSRLRERRTDAIAVLRDLLDEPDMRSVSVLALGALRATEARADIERFADDPDPIVQASVRSALRRMRGDR